MYANNKTGIRGVCRIKIRGVLHYRADVMKDKVKQGATFSVELLGEEGARLSAIAAVEAMRAGTWVTVRKTGLPIGVHVRVDRGTRCYVACYTSKGRTVRRQFSTEKWGEEGARAKAIVGRKDLVINAGRKREGKTR